MLGHASIPGPGGYGCDDGPDHYGRRVRERVLERLPSPGRMIRLRRALRFAESGQGMVEYAFILVLISLVVIVMLITTGGQIRNLFSDITYTLNNQAGL